MSRKREGFMQKKPLYSQTHDFKGREKDSHGLLGGGQGQKPKNFLY